MLANVNIVSEQLIGMGIVTINSFIRGRPFMSIFFNGKGEGCLEILCRIMAQGGSKGRGRDDAINGRPIIQNNRYKT